MTPAEQLAAARQNVVGPYLPAREEWLKGWCGQLLADVEHYGVGLSCIQAPGRHGPMMGLFEVHFRFGGIVMDADVPLSAIRLDTRIPSVRDHLIRLGCPEWARDVPAAVWCWGMGVRIVGEVGRWNDGARPACGDLPRGAVEWIGTDAVRAWDEPSIYAGGWRGWALYVAGAQRQGPETGDEGRACADLAALGKLCILREPGGWLVPMPDGGIGFFEEVNRGS